MTETMAPELLVTYVAAAADAIVNGSPGAFDWALQEAAHLLEAERLRLNSGAAPHPSPTIVALSRNLGPAYQLSDLILRSAPAELHHDISPRADRAARLRLLGEILTSLKMAASGDVFAAGVVAKVFGSATDLVLGRTGQPDLV